MCAVYVECGINSLPPGNFPFFLSADFFLNQLFKKKSGIPSECQTVWIQIRPDFLLGLICFQTVCKRYKHTTIGGKEFIAFREDEFNQH